MFLQLTDTSEIERDHSRNVSVEISMQQDEVSHWGLFQCKWNDTLYI